MTEPRTRLTAIGRIHPALEALITNYDATAGRRSPSTNCEGLGRWTRHNGHQRSGRRTGGSHTPAPTADAALIGFRSPSGGY